MSTNLFKSREVANESIASVSLFRSFFFRSFVRSFVRGASSSSSSFLSLPSRTTYPRVILDELELFRQLFRVLTSDVEEPRLRRAHELDEDGPSLGGALGHGRSLAVFLAFSSDDRLLVQAQLCPHARPAQPLSELRVLNCRRVRWVHK